MCINFEFMTKEEILSLPTGERYVFDIECYPNYFLIAFKHLKSGKFVVFEKFNNSKPDYALLMQLIWKSEIIGFNSNNYDIPMLRYFFTGVSNEELKKASDFIIQGVDSFGQKITPWKFERHFNLRPFKFNTIDLFNVCPVNGGLSENPASLKTYAARLGIDTMQDLPINPDEVLNAQSVGIVARYCLNDLKATELVYNNLLPELQIRLDMSKEYDLDLRSKSDAQIAEEVFKKRIALESPEEIEKPKFDKDKIIKFKPVENIFFETEYLQNVYNEVLKAEFALDVNGSPVLPENLKNLKIKINKLSYTLAMGGLHSKENQVSYRTEGNGMVLADNDVESFYPRIILNQGLEPDHLKGLFLKAYEKIVTTRVNAKRSGDKTLANMLKIVINGSFGKFGNKHSFIYSPELLLQVTLSGQLYLLMLIERCELAGIQVVSANTDGFVSYYNEFQRDEMRAIIAQWEQDTQFKTEETLYKSIFIRDVNNYVAVKFKGKEGDKFLDNRLGCKTKGTYSERGSALDSVMSKNSKNLVCMDAVLQKIVNNVPIEKTVSECGDMLRFCTVANVRGGGKYKGEYLGKVVRFYQSKDSYHSIEYVKRNAIVPNSTGAIPYMTHSVGKMVSDLDYQFYIDEAEKILNEIAFNKIYKPVNLFNI